MTPTKQLHLWSAGYCAILASLNWSRAIEYNRATGIKCESIVAVGGALLLAGGVMLILALRCVRAARSRLETGTPVADGKWVPSWSVVFYTLPLLYCHNTTSSWREADGALATAIGGYGHARSIWVAVFAIVGLLLFQVRQRLLPDGRGLKASALTS